MELVTQLRTSSRGFPTWSADCRARSSSARFAARIFFSRVSRRCSSAGNSSPRRSTPGRSAWLTAPRRYDKSASAQCAANEPTGGNDEGAALIGGYDAVGPEYDDAGAVNDGRAAFG